MRNAEGQGGWGVPEVVWGALGVFSAVFRGFAVGNGVSEVGFGKSEVGFQKSEVGFGKSGVGYRDILAKMSG